MKAMTTSEKLGLIRHHGEQLAKSGIGVFTPTRNDIIESAQRVIELAKSIPKAELGAEV